MPRCFGKRRSYIFYGLVRWCGLAGKIHFFYLNLYEFVFFLIEIYVESTLIGGTLKFHTHIHIESFLTNKVLYVDVY